MSTAYIGLGSNLDDPVRHVRDALTELERLPRTRVEKCSSLYRTAPVGYESQDDFINAVARVQTGLPAPSLFEALQAIEAAHGRAHPFRNAPRTLDLDLLLYDALQLEEARLTVPHPRLHERAFVLRPLLELDPDVSIPGRGRAADFLEETAGQRVERLN